MTDKRIELYREMSDLTLPECRDSCRVPFSCCSPEYCEMAIEIALEEYGVRLERTSHPILPLMGEKGCVAPPHTRPLCTLHTCSVNSLGVKIDDVEWTDKYYILRNKIEMSEFRAREKEKKEKEKEKR